MPISSHIASLSLHFPKNHPRTIKDNLRGPQFSQCDNPSSHIPSTRSSFRCVTRTTEECPETLKSVISDLTNEMKTTITSFCSPASCNIEYSKLCLADPVLEQVTVQDGKLSKDSCKKLKQVLSCVTNHTVDCLPSEYIKVQSMVEEKRVLHSEKCPLIPEPECERSIKPSDSILAELALFNSGLIPSSVCSNQLKVDTTTLEDNSDSQLLTTYRNTKIEQFCKCKECDTVKAAQIIAEISAESDICSTLSRFEELGQVISGCNSDEDITAVTDLQGDFISSCTESLPTCQTKVCSPSNWETCLKDSRTCADILTCLTDELKDCEDVEKFRYFAEAKVRALELPCTLTEIFSVGSVEQGVFVCYESAHKEIMKFPPRNDQMVLYMCPTFDTFKSCVKKIDKIDAVTDLAVQRYLKVFERVESVACDSWKTGDTIQSGFSGNGKCDINGGKTCLDDVGDILVNLGPDDDLDQVCSAGILEKLRCAATSVSDSCIATEKSDFTLYDIAYGQMYTAYQSVCGQDKLPNLGLTTETFCGTERKASVCVAKFVNHVSTNAYSVHQQKSCSELNELKECLNSQLYCNEESSKKYHAILKWAVDITSLFCAPVTTDCDVDEIKTCVKDYLTGLYSSSDDIKICSELKKTKTCIEEKTAKCSDYLKQYGKRQLHQAVGLSPESCQKQLPCEICDPAGAINCILDVHHWSKFLYPNWQQICPALDKSAGCVKQHLESCEECEKDTVNGIVTKLNSRLKDTCQYPPQTKCKIQEARQCIEKLRYDWSEMSVDVDDELEDFMCLYVGLSLFFRNIVPGFEGVCISLLGHISFKMVFAMVTS
ncbi:hypothetical protein LOTGIDRAFT_159187 [Lottia gigantea]|uniref:DUF19 domain-containing protein n=1 Tax=Lottia gigantea TaxID=225164 RepID=V4AML1_LOTGI|nr:hypothetical protein LOTGIDRAFT_159187 [Lottia gigantea]ESO98382.1 hypothetical protein LOTGIDRAFT_159187 [Lottia gigantea]